MISCLQFYCSSKIEKEKKQAAKDAGMIKTEVTGPEVGRMRKKNIKKKTNKPNIIFVEILVINIGFETFLRLS